MHQWPGGEKIGQLCLLATDRRGSELPMMNTILIARNRVSAEKSIGSFSGSDHDGDGKAPPNDLTSSFYVRSWPHGVCLVIRRAAWYRLASGRSSSWRHMVLPSLSSHLLQQS